MREIKADRLLGLYRRIEAAPYRFDFYRVLRMIECLHLDKPRIGRALKPQDEAVRLGQEASMAFAPSTLSAFSLGSEGRAPRLEQRFFGMLGPNGPLPLHLTEHARERLLHESDPTFVRFLDIFNHRFAELFYRAWAQAQPTVNLDRPREDRFSVYVGALLGMATPSTRRRDAVNDLAKLHFAGWLSRQVRTPEGLRALLAAYFRAPVQIEEYVGHWMKLRDQDRTRLGAGNSGACLGRGAVTGGRVWDRQHMFRIRLGPLSLERYEGFLPGGKSIRQIVAWVRQYFSYEFDWDMRLVLARDEVPRLALKRSARLGWTTWLGRRLSRSDAEDLTLDAERFAAA